MDFGDYKKAISKTIEADCIEVTFTYAPSRVITQLSKSSSKRIAPFSFLEEFSTDEAWKKFDDYGHFLGLSDAVQFADKSQALKIREDFLRVLALLTDEEMQLRVIAQAPRKKDGHLTANRIGFNCAMDGAFEDATTYFVAAKSQKNDVLDIEIRRVELNQYSPDAPGEVASEILRNNMDIVKRMGL